MRASRTMGPSHSSRLALWALLGDDGRRHQILLRQHLALFHRRLVEGIDAEKMRGDDGLQHEMHQQLAEAFLVEPLQMDGAHRAAVLGQGLGGGAGFRGDEIADGLAGKAGLAGELGERAVHARPVAGAHRR